MSRPLRIALLMHSLNPRGGVVHTLELADALCERGHEVTVIAPAASGSRLFRTTRASLAVAVINGPAVPGLRGMVASRWRAMADHLRAMPGLARFDVLHAQDSITACALAELAGQGRIEGFVRTVHHLDDFDDPQLAAWQALGVHAASRLLCVSALWQEVLQRDWGRQAERVGNGVNLQRFAPVAEAQDAHWLTRLAIAPHGPLWLAVGGLEARKNPLRLLHAFARVRQAHPAAQLVIAGGASLLDHADYARRFRQACADLALPLDDRGVADGAQGPGPSGPHALPPRAVRPVRLTGPLPDEALPALYRRATALAMPSLREGFGLVALEALACGTPAIVSRQAPFTEHLAPHEALWADPLDIDDLARALRDSLQPARTAPVLAAAPQVCARMGWAQAAVRHEALYRRWATQALPSPMDAPAMSSA